MPSKWKCDPDHYIDLADFVVSDDPFVEHVMARAVSDLRRTTHPHRSASFPAALADGLIEAVVEAVYDHLKNDCHLHYAYEASFSTMDGQRIRTPQEIGKNNRGTCLDLAVLFMSCLVNAQVSPIYIHIRNPQGDHSIVGVWARRAPAAAPVLITPDQVSDYLNEMIVLECTGFVEGTPGREYAVSFDVARGEAAAILADSQNSIIFALDISTARPKSRRARTVRPNPSAALDAAAPRVPPNHPNPKVLIATPTTQAFEPVCRSILEEAESMYPGAVRALVHGDPGSADDSREVRDCIVVVADITGHNPRVLRTIALAHIYGKPLVLVIREPAAPTFDARILNAISYRPDDLVTLRDSIRLALSDAVAPTILKSMLVPTSLEHPRRDSRFVIVASPLSFRRALGKGGGHTHLLRTFSDYVGVRGILQAFGLLYGFDTLPDILDPEDFDDSVVKIPMHIYCIASPKANRWTSQLLAGLGEQWIPRIQFKADPESKDLRNIKVALYADDVPLHPPGFTVNSEGDRWNRDFGLIVRAPNPFHPEFLVTIMAGRSSLGTEAACRACMDATILANLQRQLAGQGVDLEQHQDPFYALVEMRRSQADGLSEADTTSLRIRRVAVLEPR